MGLSKSGVKKFKTPADLQQNVLKTLNSIIGSNDWVYKKGKNADRIRSFGLALTLASYYDRTYQYIKNRKKTTTENKKDKQDRYKTYKGLTSTKGFKKY